MISQKHGLYCSILFCLLSAAAYIFLSSINDLQKNESEDEKAALSGAGKNLNSWWWSRAFPNAEHINEKYMAAWHKMQEIKRNTPIKYKNPAMSGISGVGGITSEGWQPIGPATLGGRILCLAIHPVNRKVLFAGSASGGIWKSTTGGVGLNAWQKVETGLPTLGVTSILIDPANPNIMYAATGEVYRTDKPVMGFNVWKTRGTYSIGILKSVDGGNSWAQIFSRNLADMFGIQKLRFDPNNTNIIYAACTDGLYRSLNSGSSWTKISDKIYVSDVLINPDDVNNVIIAVGNLTNTEKGIFRTLNGNSTSPTWSKVVSGLPSSFKGFISFDFHNASNTVFASIGVSSSASIELFKSIDFGVTWEGISNSGHTSFQYWFAHAAAVDPNNVNRIFLAGVDKFRIDIARRSVDKTGIGEADPYMGSYILPEGQEGVSNYVHSDVHSIIYVPGRSDSVYFCTDGGIFLSTNANTSTASNVSFQSCNSGLQTAQFFGPVGQSQKDANFFVGGLQDNNTVVYDGITRRWKRMIGGDGGPSAIHPENDNIVLSSRDARAVYKSTNKSGSYIGTANGWGSVADSRTGFMAPIAFSKSNPNIVYLGSDNLHRSTNAGDTWSGNTYTSATNYIEQRNKTSVALAVSPTNENKVYVSTSPFAQYDNDVDDIYVNGDPNLFVTTTGGIPFTNIKSNLPNRFVMDIVIHPTNDNTLWIVMGGYGSSHVFKSTNGGTSWTDIDKGNLPDVPTNAIMLDPSNSNIIYIGNDLGIFVTSDGGVNWHYFSGGLWDATLIMDLVPVPGKKLRAATHGKGVFERALFDPTILPVTFVSFKGIQQAQNNILSWKVAHETNLSRYIIEKSIDGLTFQQAATVNAKNVYTETAYHYTDANVSKSIYYRVKSVDNDGKFQFTEVVHLKRSEENSMRIIGNPFYQEIHLKFQLHQGGKIKVNLYDSKGALISNEVILANTGQTDYKIRGLERLPFGVYQVEAILNNQRWVQKLVKK